MGLGGSTERLLYLESRVAELEAKLKQIEELSVDIGLRPSAALAAIHGICESSQLGDEHVL